MLSNEGIGRIKNGLDQAADKAQAAASQAKAALNQGIDQVQELRDAIAPLIEERPYVAIALAAVAGVFLGLLFAGRGPKVVYVKPKA